MLELLCADKSRFSPSPARDFGLFAGCLVAAWALPARFQLDIVLTYSITVAMLASGLIIVFKNAPHGASLSEKFLLCGPVFFAMPMSVFGTQHFLDHVNIGNIIPKWVPAHAFFTYLVGAGLIAASLGIVFRKLAGLAAALIGVMFLFFEALMHIPIAVMFPHVVRLWALVGRDFIFCWGALSLAATYTTKWRVHGTHWLIFAARLFMGGFIIFYGVQYFFHPDFVPGVPLRQSTPAFVPFHLLWGYLTGVVYVSAGVLLLINRTAHLAAMWLSFFIICMVFICSVPFMIQRGGDVIGLDVPLDNLMLSGAFLCLSGSLAGKSISPKTEPDQRPATVVAIDS